MEGPIGVGPGDPDYPGVEAEGTRPTGTSNGSWGRKVRDKNGGRETPFLPVEKAKKKTSTPLPRSRVRSGRDGGCATHCSPSGETREPGVIDIHPSSPEGLVLRRRSRFLRSGLPKFLGAPRL